MKTIRRIYFYAVALVSLEVVVWALIGLGRSAFQGAQVGAGVDQLASALAYILVGLPVFVLHWWLAQREALQDPAERWSAVRAAFLYAALTALMLPVAQNALALVDRWLVQAFGLDSSRALLGGEQVWSDNLLAIVMNGLIALYFRSVLENDWRAEPQGEAHATTRRVYRYLWVLYTLGLAVFGVGQMLGYLFDAFETVGGQPAARLANGLSFTLIGVPLWVLSWRTVQRSLSDPAERASFLRLAVLYGLAFLSVGGVLLSAGLVLAVVLRALLGETFTAAQFLAGVSDPLSVAVPLGAVWAYHGRVLGAEMEALPDRPRRAGLRRLYHYVLSLAGLAATFAGLQMLLTFILDAALGSDAVWGFALRRRLADALATLLVGAPLWLRAWLPMVREAAAEDEAGDHARRSLVRRAYLYLALFAGVMGVMFGAGALLFQLLRLLLGESLDQPLRLLLEILGTLLLFAALLAYHWRALRADGRRAQRLLAARHGRFPVLVLEPPEGGFAAAVAAEIEQGAPELPVAVHAAAEGAPDAELSAARAVVLPAALAADPPEALRLWLVDFSGHRLVAPAPAAGWTWLGVEARSPQDWGKRAARALVKLAEGEAPGEGRAVSPWAVVGYVFAGLVGLALLCGLVTAALEGF